MTNEEMRSCKAIITRLFQEVYDAKKLRALKYRDPTTGVVRVYSVEWDDPDWKYKDHRVFDADECVPDMYKTPKFLTAEESNAVADR